jgi:hypothetical protein
LETTSQQFGEPFLLKWSPNFLLQQKHKALLISFDYEGLAKQIGPPLLDGNDKSKQFFFISRHVDGPALQGLAKESNWLAVLHQHSSHSNPIGITLNDKGLSKFGKASTRACVIDLFNTLKASSASSIHSKEFFLSMAVIGVAIEP